MNKPYVLLCTLLFLSLAGFLQAQIEQVSVGASYSEQAYYDLETGDVNSLGNTEWDIAFSNLGAVDGGIFVNESASLSGFAPAIYLAETTDWAEPITDLSGFVDTLRLYNPEVNWEYGAFNEPRDTSSALDYGWGTYNINSHQIEGDRIFVIQLRDGSYLKFILNSLAGGAYNFTWANLDNTNEQSASIAKSGDQPVKYFSFATGDEVAFNFEYDLVFQRYVTPLDAGDGTVLDYTVAGVLLAPNTQAVVADGVDIETVDEMDYRNDYSPEVKTIGHEWKAFDFSLGWIIDDDRAQFIKTSEGSIYKLIFLDFEGSATGTTTLQKTFVGMSSAEDVTETHTDIEIYPNPVVDRVRINTMNNREHTVSMYSNTGQLVLNSTFEGSTEITLPSTVSNGIYYMVVGNKSNLTTKTIVVKK